MIIAGLTGSIATGKSTVGAMFRSLGVPVYEADALVHEIYAGPQAAVIEAAFPGTLIGGAIDRQKLASYVLDDGAALTKLENIIHPLVRAKFTTLAEGHAKQNAPHIIFDIPLLLEHGLAQAREHYAIDKVIVTYCDPATQKSRAMARDGMTEDKFNAILAKQLPQDNKRALADFELDTTLSLEKTRAKVEYILQTLIQTKLSTP